MTLQDRKEKFSEILKEMLPERKHGGFLYQDLFFFEDGVGDLPVDKPAGVPVKIWELTDLAEVRVIMRRAQLQERVPLHYKYAKPLLAWVIATKELLDPAIVRIL